MNRINANTLAHYFKPMAILAVPIALQSLISFLVNLADNMMIGRLGDTAISGVYMGTQMFTLLQWFVTGITISMTILATQYWGRQDVVSIKKIGALGVVIGLPITLLITAACLMIPSQLIGLFTNEAAVIAEGTPYLRIVALSFPFYCISQIFVALTRAVENPKVGLVVASLTLIVNVILNYILIFGCFGLSPMGSAGAAVGTLVARILEALLMTAYMFFSESQLKLRPEELLKVDRSLLRDFLRYGTPVLIGELVWGFNTIMRSYFMGHFDQSVIAAFSMINLLSQTVFVWILALESAAGILTGKMIGASRQEEIRPYAKNMQVIFLIIGVAAVAILYAIRGLFFSFYDVTPEAMEAAYALSNVMIPVVFFSVYEDMTLCGIVKCGGETSFVLKTDSILVFLVMLPGCLIASWLGAPPPVIYLLLQIDQILKCAVAYVKVNQFRWAHDLTAQHE